MHCIKRNVRHGMVVIAVLALRESIYFSRIYAPKTILKFPPSSDLDLWPRDLKAALPATTCVDNLPWTFERCTTFLFFKRDACPCVCASVHLSATFVHSVKVNKHIFEIFSPSGRQAILAFPYQTAWQYIDGNSPNVGVECRWGRQKSRFWANIWLHCVMWSVPAASAIHIVATNHSEFITLVAGKRSSLVMAGNNDEVCDNKPQRYAEDNVTQW